MLRQLLILLTFLPFGLTAKSIGMTENKPQNPVQVRATNDLVTLLICDITAPALYHLFIGEVESRDMSPHPYHSDGISGDFVTMSSMNEKTTPVAFRIQSSYTATDASIDLVQTQAELQPLHFLGIEGGYQRYMDYDFENTHTLELSSFTLNFYRIREKWITGWWGIGVVHGGSQEKGTGLRFQMGGKVYPFNPISLEANWESNFIPSYTIKDLRLACRFHFNRLATFGGYHRINYNSEIWKGLTLGVEYSF